MSWKERLEKPFYQYLFPLERIFEHFERPQDLKLLDVGTGDGFFLKLCDLKGIGESFGIEPNKKRREIAKKRIGKDRIMKDFRVVNGDFDVITMLQVLEHVEEKPIDFLKKYFRILKAGGLLIFLTPIEYLLDDHEHVHHFQFYDVYNLANFFSDNFEIYLISKFFSEAPELNDFGVVIHK